MVRNNTGNSEEGQITRALAEFSANLEYEDLSPERYRARLQERLDPEVRLLLH